MAEAAYEGNTFLELSLAEGDELPADAIAAWNAMSQESHWLGWRYIPNVDGRGAARNHPTTYPQGMVVKQARTATATIAWKALTWQQAPTQAHITAALASMPVPEVTAAFVTRGESILLGDKARALR